MLHQCFNSGPMPNGNLELDSMQDAVVRGATTAAVLRKE
uniref:Uncharacterized protein n=1 Tax=Arundo donax TaxID=35708 RepID=A0A0A9FQ57_ARUDO